MSDRPAEAVTKTASKRVENGKGRQAPGEAAEVSRRTRIAMLAVVGILAVTIVGFGALSLWPKPPGDKTAPDFTLPKVDGTGNLTLSVLRGKVVFLDFMATWCVPCQKAMPSLVKVYEKYEGWGVVFLSIDVDPGDAGKVPAFAARFNATWDFLVDTKGVSVDYRLGVLPGYFAVDKSGRLAAEARGDQGPGGQELYEQMIEKALAADRDALMIEGTRTGG